MAGHTTFSIMTLSITTLGIMALRYSILSVIYLFSLSKTLKGFLITQLV